LVIDAKKEQIRFHPFQRFEHPEQRTLLGTREAGFLARGAGVWHEVTTLHHPVIAIFVSAGGTSLGAG